MSWVTSRRGFFRIFDDAVQCGNWTIQAKDVRDAILFEARKWFLTALVLQVTTHEKTYQFGFNPWARVADHLPFAFRRERVELGYSTFSIVARVLLLIYIGYVLWSWLAVE